MLRNVSACLGPGIDISQEQTSLQLGLYNYGVNGKLIDILIRHWFTVAVFKYERIPGLLATSYEKASRMVIEGYYSQVAGEIVSHIQQGTMLDLGTGPGYLPIQIVNGHRSLKLPV